MLEETPPQLEERTLRFWKDRQIFEKSLALRRAQGKPFRFYEGPPTANAGPGIHHMLSRIFKDIVCRYKTMQGFYVGRKAGWDTHGLPVEIQIEKELGIKHKSEIEKFGVALFNKKAKEAVWRYKEEWEKFTERIGFWLDLKNPYITYEAGYMESLWWIIQRFWEKGLLEQDYKVVPYCPRCETPLSSHEVAQGYKMTRDPSIYVRLRISAKSEIRNPKFEIRNKFQIPNSKFPEYLLVWTTTPWTLPANVAIAVNPAAVYTKYRIGDEYYWSVAPPPFNKSEEVEAVEKRSGKALAGLSYEPIFSQKIENRKSKIAFRVVAGDFVSTEEGTGLVHIAPAFGEDDMKLAHQAKLPIILNVSPEGEFAFTKTELRQEPFFKKIQGRFVKSADPLIFEELKRRGILYSGDLESTEHEYPFCWRCDSPLLYYAHKSWFVRMSRLKDELLANNSKINWIPAHIKEGRFGEWLREVKDWAFSRDRYWGTPLPIWKCAKCGNIDTVGSVLELNQKAYKPNKFFIMRHGDADHIREDYIAAWPEPAGKASRLTEKGRTEAELAAKALFRKKIDIIVSSDLVRAKETTAILKKNLTGVKVLFDPRLRELNCGIFNYRKISDYRKFFKKPLEKFFQAPSGAETLIDAQKRCFSVWRELNRKYRGKNILLIGHADPLWALEGKLKGLTPEQILKTKYIAPGEWRELSQNDLPYSDEAELDLHRPYVDDLRLECGRCKSEMRRVPEVADVWFDSGAMPFAQAHFPFACAKIQNPNSNPSTSSGLTFSSLSLRVEGLSEAERVKFQNYQKLAQKCLDFPSDYIAEGVDQTRGWFYTLLAVSTALGYLVPPFRNVICLGHILDEKGEKMSKSKGNAVNPWEMMAKYGADSLRWYFFTINSPGEPKRFSEKDLAKSHQELLVLLNVLQFFRTYAPRKISKRNRQKANSPLDKWILARLTEITVEVTVNLERYEINQAARQISVFLDDLSRWYIRRSRRRFQKPGSSKKLAETSAVLAHVLAELAKLLAPFIPFTAEHIWQSVTKRLSGKHPESVHLVLWPVYKALAANKSILVKMRAVRELAALGLKLRQTASIKVRQPLRTFWVLEKRDSVRISDDFSDILAEELNVKKIEFTRRLPAGSAGLPEGAEIIRDENGKWKAALDIGIDAGLRAEGELRELIRNLQELRQAAGFEPKDRIELYIDVSQTIKTEISRSSAQLKKEVGAVRLIFSRARKFSAEKEYKRADGAEVWIAIRNN